jgi:hypothetical protein
MTGLRNTIMRFVLVLMMFQFIAPAFMYIVCQSDESQKGALTYHTENSTIVFPQFLKEKEETEEESTRFSDAHFDFIPLIDFTDQSFVLTELHETKFTPLLYRDRYDVSPPLFTLHSSYII